MPTSTKKSKTNRAAGRNSKNKKNRGLGSAIGGLASRLGPGKNGGRAGKSSKRGLTGIVAGAGLGTRATKPSKRRRPATAAGAGLRFRSRKPSKQGRR